MEFFYWCVVVLLELIIIFFVFNKYLEQQKEKPQKVNEKSFDFDEFIFDGYTRLVVDRIVGSYCVFITIRHDVCVGTFAVEFVKESDTKITLQNMDDSVSQNKRALIKFLILDYLKNETNN